jgi:hypothetical protein
MRMGGVAVVGVAGLLAFAGAGRYYQVHSARNAAHQAERQAAQLSAQVAQLQAKTAVHGKMESRAAMDVQALKGDVDYVRVLGQLAAVMPPNLHITNAALSRQSSTTSGGGVGTLTVSVAGSGDGHAAATWLRDLQKDPDLAGTWVGGLSITTTAGVQTINFSSSTNLTTTAQSDRSEAAKP